MSSAFKCTKCHEVRPSQDFPKKDNKRGHSTICRVCTRIAQNKIKSEAKTKLRTAPDAPNAPVYAVYVPKAELGYYIRNNGLKHVPSRGFI